MKVRLVGSVVLTITLIATATLILKKSIGNQITPTPEVAPAVIGEKTQVPETRIINISAGSYFYDPSLVRVKKGERVKIVLSARDTMHDVNIDELGLKIPATRPGETNFVEFTAEKVGEYEYYCSLSQHRKFGQVGKLVIE